VIMQGPKKSCVAEDYRVMFVLGRPVLTNWSTFHQLEQVEFKHAIYNNCNVCFCCCVSLNFHQIFTFFVII